MNKKNFITIKQVKYKWRLIAIFSLVSVLLVAILSFFIVDLHYEASVKIFIGKEKFINVSENYTNEEVQMYQNLLQTYCEVITTEDLIDKSIKQANGDKTIKEVKRNIDINIIKDSQIMVIKYSDNNAQLAYDILYNITNNFISNSKKLYKNSNVIVLQQINIVDKSMVNYSWIIMIITALIGAIIGGVCIFIREYFMSTFNTKESVEEYLGVHVLSVIPKE